MHLSGDKMSQLMHPPRQHFVPFSQFESPHLANACAYLGHIWDISWAIFGHISGIYIRKPLFNLHFSGDKLSHLTKCPTFSPATKCPNLCTYAQESYGKLLGHFVGCPTLLIWRPIPWAKFAHLANMYWTYLGYILTTFWLHSGYLLATFLLHFGYIFF